MNTIFNVIRDYETSFLHHPVSIVDGYDFDQLDTIKKIHKYYASQFDQATDGSTYFFNITKSRCKNAAKNIDLDTKDLHLRVKPGGDETAVWLLRRDFKRWLEESDMSVKMNKAVDLLPRYGTIVAKRTGGDSMFEMVDVRNIKCDPTVERIGDSWVIESIFMTPSELAQYSNTWDNVSEAISSFRTYRKENYVDDEQPDTNMGDANYIHIREFYGDVTEDVFYENGVTDKFVKAHYIVVLAEDADKGANGRSSEGLVLFKEEWKASRPALYKDCHYDKMQGRWLGVGIVEDGFELQAIKNRQTNQLIESQDLANLTVFQTGDELVVDNVMADLVNGDIIETQGGLVPINTQVRDLGGFQVMSGELTRMYNDLANSYDVTTGESLPSGTPFSLGALTNANANKYFDKVRENLGIFWKEIMDDWILPELAKDLNKEHILEITDDRELQELARSINEYRVSEAIKTTVLEQGRLPTEQELQLLESVLESQLFEGGAALEIPKGYYENMLKDAKTVVTNENESKMVKAQELQALLGMLQANPELADHPIFQKLLDLTGYGTIDVTMQGGDMASMLKNMIANAQGQQGSIGATTQPAGMAGAEGEDVAALA